MNKRQLNRRQRPEKTKDKVLRAMTRHDRVKKHRAVVAQRGAGFNDDGSGVSKKIFAGLFVLLILHLVAVGAIALHSKYYKGGELDVVEAEPIPHTKEEQSAVDRAKEEAPKISKNQAYTWVHAGETYKSIAARLEVDEQELRSLNNNRPLKAGLGIKKPVRKVSMVSPAMQQVGNKPQNKVKVLNDNAHMIVQESKKPVKVISQKVVPKTPASKTHTIKSGDTFWALSQKYGVSVADIQDANPKISPTRVKVGDKVLIPVH